MSSLFRTQDSADLPAFLVGLRTFIETHNPPTSGSGINPSDQWQAEFAAIAGEVGEPIRLMLDFIGQLQADGLFDPLLAGVGNLTSDSQNYRVEITDLSTLDPHSTGVSFLQRNKGNPWFGFRREDIASPDPRPWVFDRRVRKKKTEISFSGGLVPPNIPLFLWHWFARVRSTRPAQFTDCPNISNDTLLELRDHMDTALIWPDAGGIYMDENCAVMLHWTSLGWTSNITIPDPSRPHALTEPVQDLIDLGPDILIKLIADARRNAAP